MRGASPSELELLGVLLKARTGSCSVRKIRSADPKGMPERGICAYIRVRAPKVGSAGPRAHDSENYFSSGSLFLARDAR